MNQEKIGKFTLNIQKHTSVLEKVLHVAIDTKQCLSLEN